jgi:hypothetical protein
MVFLQTGQQRRDSSAGEFTDAALNWFGDPDPRQGTAWEKGQRLAKLIRDRRTLLVLDGLEPLQYPPGPQEGRLREPSLQALLRELAAFNTGLCVITTRLPVFDMADYERTSALRRDLEELSRDAGAKLLRALGVRGSEAELLSASDEFGGHCLALTLLGSYLTDAYNGDIRCRKEVSERLTHDVRQGVHARKVMESYQSWFGEGPELSILRMLGLFDRPADERAIETLVKSPAIPGLTETLRNLRPAEWRTILSRLRRAKLLAGEDPHNRGQLDAHPLVREYFGEQLRSQQTEAWKECNRRLYQYYKMLARALPESFSEMERLFLAVICGCNAGLFRQALHEVYVPRIQRGDTCFAARILGARETLLLVLAHFFEHERWSSALNVGVEAQSLTAEDQLFILMQAGLYLTATRGFGAPEAQICYQRVESLSHSLGRLVPHSALVGQWRYSLATDKLTETMQIAERIYSLSKEQNDAALAMGAYRALSGTLYFLGDFKLAREYATRGLQIWHTEGSQHQSEEITAHPVACLFYSALCQWHLGEIASSQRAIREAVALAKELNDIHGLAVSLFFAGVLAHEHNPAQVEHLASEIIELSTRQGFILWLNGGKILRGWARSAAGDTTEGIAWIKDGIQDFWIIGTMRMIPFFLALEAEALQLVDRTSEALRVIQEAIALAEKYEERCWSAELHRLRGVFLLALDAEESEIHASFREAVRIAREQSSISLEKRAEATYAAFRRKQYR